MSAEPTKETPSPQRENEDTPQRRPDVVVPATPASSSMLGFNMMTLSKYQNYIILAVLIAAAAGGYWYWKNRMNGGKGSKASAPSKSSKGSKSSKSSKPSKASKPSKSSKSSNVSAVSKASNA